MAVFMLGLLWVALLGQPSAGAQKAPEPTPGSVPRLVLAFYYPWYGTPEGPGGKGRGGRFVHWEGVDPGARAIKSSTHYPTGGAYDSLDPAVIARHCEQAKAAGIDGLIVSWWGRTSYEDQAVKPVLDECQKHGLKATVYFEQVAKPGTPDSVAAEIVELVERFGQHPAMLRVKRDGAERPVVFVYSRAVGQLGVKGWKSAVEKIAASATVRPLLIGDDFGAEAVKVFDGAHAYGPMGDLAAAEKKGESAETWAKRVMPSWAGAAQKAGKVSCVTVFPGYDDTKVRKPGTKVDREGGALYDTLWREAIAARPDWVLITSFNEWHEGSEIEPSAEEGGAHLAKTAEWTARFKAAAPAR